MSDDGWIGVDLDGTLAHYDGWVSESHIGPPVPKMVGRVREWLAEGRDVRIFTARSHNFSGEVDVIDLIEKWCLEHIGQVLRITATKDFKMIALWDDRCVQVVPNTGDRAAPLRLALPKFARGDAYFFGCRYQAGHYFWDTWGKAPGGFRDTSALLPWEKIDGGLVPRGNSSGLQGLASLHHRDEWTAIAFCDRSIDHRGGSNSAFFFRMPDLTFEETMDAIRDTFPTILDRLPFEIVLDEETST